MDPGSGARTAEWYATPAGRRASGLLRRAVRPLLRTSATTRLLAIGATAILDGFDTASVERVVGVAAVPVPGWLVADPAQLPFAEAVFDVALVAHAFETSAAPAKLLRELWRVLAPAGEIVLIVPNRAGLWSLSEGNPFGEGRPYGRGGLGAALAAAMFEVVEWRMALAAPPLRRLGWSEAVLARTLPGLSGVHVVRAAKRDGLAPVAGSGARVLRPAVEGA